MPRLFSDDGPPIPPADLIHRIGASFEAAEIPEIRREFDLGGQKNLHSFELALAGLGRSLTDFERILDFGCGCGRLIRHLGPISERVQVDGVDVDAEMIEWLTENIPFGSYVVGPHEPPLPHPDGFFDLVINHSVFTHLDERMQDLWLAELRRVTAPEGILLLTVHGATTWNRTLADMASAGEDAERYRSRLETDVILFISDDAFFGSTHAPYYHTTFHAPWYVFEQWSRYFEVVSYRAKGSMAQDLVVLRRRPDDEEVPEPIGHRSGPVEPQAALDRPVVAERLEHASALIAARPAPRTLLGRLKRRLLRNELGRQDQIDAALLAAVRELREADDGHRRTLHNLTSGLYEQGRRITIATEELRRELTDRPRPKQ